MNDEPIIIEKWLPAAPERIWKALTDRDEMAQWYFDLAAFRPEAGFSFQFTGGPPEKQYLHLCTITEAVPFKKIAYSWRYDGYEGDSLVSFELFEEATGTLVRLTHQGLESFPASNPHLARENFVQGWSHIIPVALTEYLTKNQ